jgi:hypothetical protein
VLAADHLTAETMRTTVAQSAQIGRGHLVWNFDPDTGEAPVVDRRWGSAALVMRPLLACAERS